MAKDFYDAGAAAKRKVSQRYTEYLEKAKAASDGGKLKLVSEHVCQPFQGHTFETAPDPQHKSTDPYEFNKAARPGMGEQHGRQGRVAF